MPWLLEMTLLVAAIMVSVHLYISWRIYSTTKANDLGAPWRIAPFALLLSFYLFPLSSLVYQGLWGDPDMLTFSQPLTYWFWFGLVFSFQVLTGLIILDLLKWTSRLFSNFNRHEINKIHAWTFGVMAAGLFVYTGVKMIHDTRRIQVHNARYSSNDVPPAFDGFRIAHITDLQADEYTGRPEIARYIKKVNELNPDVVIFTGDLISYGTDFIAMAARELSNAEATYGTYTVVGDHDYWAGVANMKRELDKYGIPILRDRNTFIKVGNDSLLLTGITEVYSKHIPRDSLRLLTEAYPQVPMKILATHQATDKVIDQAQEAKYELLLAGHTHGGQLRVPFMFMTFSAAEEDTPYLSGAYHFGKMLLNVDNGLGFTLAPVRYNAPPGISVIELNATN